jgi:glycosyltransferase involved in cell wall biosynthesis
MTSMEPLCQTFVPCVPDGPVPAVTGIDIVICTCNRASKLRNLLRSFESVQIPSGVRAQLIVVDNGSTDDTRDAVETAQRSLVIPVRYLYDATRGLARCRNLGISVAQGDIVAFTDDDCVVCCDWVASIWGHFHREPGLGMLGGRVEPANPSAYPLTLRLSSAQERLTSARQLLGFIHGCNMAFRREALERIGHFDTRFGAGASLKAADDTDLVYRFYRLGYPVEYAPDVCVYHDHGRLRVGDAIAVANAYAVGNGALLTKHLMSRDAEVLELLGSTLAGCFPYFLRNGRTLSLREAVGGINRLAHLILGAVRYAWVSLQPAHGSTGRP